MHKEIFYIWREHAVTTFRNQVVMGLIFCDPGHDKHFYRHAGCFGPHSLRRHRLMGTGIPIIYLRRSLDGIKLTDFI